MTLRVLHVSQPVDAGVPAVVCDYVSLLAGSGVEIAVACPASPFSGRVRDIGVDWLPWAATRQPGPAVLGEARRLGRVIRDWSPDVVHLHSAKAGLAGRLALRGRIATVFQPHAWSFDAATGPLRVASIAWEARGSRWSSVTVCVSEAELETGRRRGVRGEMAVVPNRVDTELWKPREQHAARIAAGAPLDVPIAVCAGRLCEQKGQDDLVRVWSGVRAALPDALLILVGDGPDRERIAAMCTGTGSGVRLVGHSVDVGAWLAAADLVVVPSRWEAMAMVPLEAEASGRPVIATDVAGMAEALSEGSTVVPAHDSAALQAALIDALKDRAALARRGELTRSHALARPGRASLALELLAVYELACGLPLRAR